MDKQTFSGRTLDDALDAAARSLGTEKSLVSYNVVSGAKEGGLFAKLFNRSVKIEAWVESDHDDLQAAAREAVRAAISQNQKASARSVQPQNRPSQAAPAQVAAAQPAAPAGVSPGKGRGERAPRDEGRAQQSQQKQAAQKPQQQQAAPGKGRGERSARPERGAGAPRAQRPERAERTERAERPERPERAERAERPARPERTPRNVEATERPGLDIDAPGVMDTLTEFTRTFLTSFAIDSKAVSFDRQSNGDVVVQVEDAHLEELLGKTDKLSLAFEHVFKRIAQKRLGDVSARISLNAGKAQDVRDETLRATALSLAEQVKISGKTVTLAAKSPQERRVIHLTLDGMEGVGTRSVGTGDHRKLVIFSTDKAHLAQNQQQREGNGQGRGGRGGRGGRDRQGARSGRAQGEPGKAQPRKEAGLVLAAGEPGEDAAKPPREGGPREGGPREGGPREGGPREGGPREGGPREGGPGEGEPRGRRRRGNRRRGGREGEPREGEPREGGPREGGPREGGPREGGPREGGPRPEGISSESPAGASTGERSESPADAK